MPRFMTTIALVVTFGSPAFAQTDATRDFSSAWILNAGKGTLAKDSTIRSETVVIDYKESAITFHYKTDGRKSTEKYIPDGQPRVTDKMASGQVISRRELAKFDTGDRVHTANKDSERYSFRIGT